MGGELRNSRQSERQGGHDYKNGLVRCAISSGAPQLRAFVRNVFKADFVSENISYLTWSSKNLAAIDPNSVDYDSSAKLSASDALDLRDEFIDPKGASQVNLSSRDRRVALKAFDNVFPKLSTARKNYRDAVDAFDKAAPADRDKLAGRIGIARQSLKNAKRDAAKQELAAGQQAELVGALKIVDQSVGKLAHTTIELAFTNAGVTLRDD